MLENFFQLAQIPIDHISGTYDIRLVILSYLVATFASYIALDITGRLRDVSNTELNITLWLCGGALAMGAGIWSMHFIGMLAFKMNMPMIYDPYFTVLSMLVAIAASGFALYVLKSKIITGKKIILSGVILGLAIAAMHYTGMAAMEINMSIHYLPGLFFLSIFIAILASEAALWLALKSTQVIPRMQFRLKFVSAFIMGAAICGMHYTGMAAAVFTPKMTMATIYNDVLNPELLAMSIAAVAFVILGIAFVASTYKESLNQQLLLTARQAGMAEVAASILHNIGNVLNTVNVSSLIISEKIKQSKLSGLIDLNQLIQENKLNLSDFIKNDPRGVHFPEFIHSLSKCWETEKAELMNESKIVMKNVEHIKNIIATQQDLSRVVESEQVVSIENVLEESILISGIDNLKYQINIKKTYEHMKPVMIDKVKLMQILVNLLQNARDSLDEAKPREKIITLDIKKTNPHFYIHVSDNGLGIGKENLTRIFSYGFTTKKSGHGFGLHTSAIAAKEMGGSLKAISEGEGKGAVFILTLPYKSQ
ncbi:MAG: sensory box histidine kinase/response regulator [uncultured bacterium]|nr:MAG: sensory box histidine kinase/response regulator [uncultured bacterium]